MTDTIPAVDLTGLTAADRSVAICCSGGGIRSASFNLGALQELAAHGVLDDVDLICAVSGGSYLAAAHSVAANCSNPRPPVAQVYAPGSPEEKWLRGNSRYLLPDAKVALYGAIRLIVGLFANLVLVLAWLFVLGHTLGWLLHWRDWLSGLDAGRPAASVGAVWIAPLAFAAAAIVVVMARRDQRPWPTIAFWTMTAAVIVALGCLLAPQLIRSLYDTGLHDHGDAGVVVRGFGFASPSGCAEARAHEPDPTRWICGEQSASTSTTAEGAPRSAGGQGAGFLAFVAALGGLVRLVLGKLRGDSPKGDGSTLLSRAWEVVRSRVLPWVGSLAVGALLALVGLRWVADGSIQGATGAEMLKVAIVGGGIVVARFVIDVNHTSMHGFYRDRLAFAYGVARSGESMVVDRPDVRLSDLGPSRPDLVVCAAANVNVGIANDEVPPGRDAMSFTFTPHHIGLSARAPAGTSATTAHVPGRQDLVAATSQYERVVGSTMTLFGGVALSGAAVSPIMGKMTRPALRFLLAIANVRLGLWLPNPRLVAIAADPSLPTGPLSPTERLRVRAFRARLNVSASVWSRFGARVFFRWTQPNMRLLLAEAFGHHRVRTSWLYVSDGGHFENLGLVEALRRGATEVYVFDASGDAVTSWNTLGQAVALARSGLGVEIEIDPQPMVADGKCVQPFVHGSFTYTWERTPRRGVLHFCKLGVWPGAPWDVQAYKSRHSTFPTDSTLQQMYDDEEFEAYRALGRAATHAMLRSSVEQPAAGRDKVTA